MRVDGTDLFMIRGDSESITVTVKENSKIYQFKEGDIVYFTVKNNPYTEDIILQKIIAVFDNNEARIEINPEDTKKLNFKQYVYDIQLTSGGRVTTVVPCSKFTLNVEVTYD